MLQKFLMCITLWLLFQLLVKINCQAFNPGTRATHTATLIDDKLYILGGYNDSNVITNDFFYLNVSVQFNTQRLSWNDLSNITSISTFVPAHNSAASVKGGADNSTLFLYGGFISNPRRRWFIHLSRKGICGVFQILVILLKGSSI